MKPTDNQTIDVPPADPLRPLLERYEAAWKSAQRGGPTPSAEAFLAELPQHDREAAREALARIARQYQAESGATIDLPSPADAGSAGRDTEVVAAGGATHTSAEFELGPAPPGAPADQRATIAPEEAPREQTIDQAPPAFQAATVDPDDEAARRTGKPGGAASTASPARARRKGAAGLPTVAGYELLGELGRGGMGVVYKARHVRLNRIVALKMILSGAAASADQLARFNTEAEAVAQIQHPNIVQIYEVGEHDGLPFFSLEFVDAGSLQQKYAGKAQPARDAAEMIHLLSLAMACAHGHGIIHRDLKPANILLTSDGLPKVTDFGLAKRLESDCGTTRSGTLMGTPSYMAPEQARGDVHGIGPLADVYALGVILYEALTGRVPFVGTSVLDTLQQVQTLEPVPPSRLQPRIPADVETICLKCLQKEPKKRYASAEDLADDLKRFLGGEPIKARPVGGPERLWRWCKRNPRVAALSGILLALLVVAAVASTAVAFRMANLRAEALDAKQLADEKAAAEEVARGLADQRAEEARQAEEKATASAKAANKQADLSLNTLQMLIGKVQERLDRSPGTLPLKRELLKYAMEGLNDMSREAQTAQNQKVSMAAAHMRMAEALKQVGEGEAAIAQYQACHAVILKRAEEVRQQKDPPNLDAAMNNLASTFTGLGDMKQNLRRDMPAALTHFREALRIREELVNNPPLKMFLKPAVIKKNLAGSYLRVGRVLLLLGDPAEALRNNRLGLTLCQELAAAAPKEEPDTLLDLAIAHVMVGEAGFRRDDEAAPKHCDEAAALFLRLLAVNKENPAFKQGLAWTLRVAGDLALRAGRLADARRHLNESLARCRELATADPMNIDYQLELASTLARSAVVAQRLGDEPTAKSQFRECLQVRRQALAKDPGNDRRQIELLALMPRCGEHAEAARQAEKLLAGPRDSELLFEAGRCYAQCAAAVPDDPRLQAQYQSHAIEALKEALALGYKDLVALQTEPDLEPVRGTEGYKQLSASATSQ